MSQERLTDRNLLTAQAASNNLRFYVVDKDKTDEHPDGDSFQVSREALIEILGSNTPSTTPGTQKITFGLEAVNNTAGQSTTVNEMIAAMNTVGFTINEGELALLEIQVLQVINGAQWRVFKRYLFKNNNVSGTWGTGSTNGPITYANLIEVAWRQFIKIDANSEYNDLGDIGSSTIEDHLNGLPANTYVLTNLATDYYFTCIRNGTEQVYQVKPLSLPLTISNDTVTSADFDLVASSENPEPAPTPTEEQIEFKIQEATVSGTFELDLATYSDFYLTMTADTELSFKAGTLPAVGFGKRFKLVLTGAFAQTWEDAYMNSFGDDYEGTKLNDVLCEVAHLASGYRGEAINQQRETA